MSEAKKNEKKRVEVTIDTIFDRLPEFFADDEDVKKSIEAAISSDPVQKKAKVTVKYVDIGGKIKTKTLNVPLLAICPIPFIPIDSIKVELKKIEKK